MKDIFLNLMVKILKNCMNFIIIYNFHVGGWKLNNSKSLQLIYMKKWLCYTHDKFKTIIKLWTSIKKSWPSDYISSKCLAKIIYSKKMAKNRFEKYFFKLRDNAFFGKAMENVRNHRDIKLFTTKRRRNYLVSEPNLYTTKIFTEYLLGIEMKNNADTYE